MLFMLKNIYWNFKDKKYQFWYLDIYLYFFYKKYKFDKEYFLKSNIQMNLHKHVKKRGVNSILEIGTYEGLASIWFAKKYIANKNSKLHIVDPFFLDDQTTEMSNNTEQNFLFNFSRFQNNKVNFYKQTSDNFFKNCDSIFSFIYIDGSHELDTIARDLINADKHLSKDGIIWCDDYKKSTVKCYIPINKFLEKNSNRYEVIFKDYQIAFKKIQD